MNIQNHVHHLQLEDFEVVFYQHPNNGDGDGLVLIVNFKGHCFLRAVCAEDGASITSGYGPDSIDVWSDGEKADIRKDPVGGCS